MYELQSIIARPQSVLLHLVLHIVFLRLPVEGYRPCPGKGSPYPLLNNLPVNHTRAILLKSDMNNCTPDVNVVEKDLSIPSPYAYHECVSLSASSTVLNSGHR
ncbi:hypothetical protein CW304_26185 [Bacillus sp. UFRGS-B20]|nr:hypothetical protein CW304_26185 [Bacillus sp. UFRGS-B20]